MEHVTLEMMMEDLDILSEDMEVAYKGDHSNVHCDDYGVFDDELEHSFLDNILEEMEMDREPNYEEVEMAVEVEMMESAPVLEPEIIHDYEHIVQGNCGGDSKTKQSQTKTIIINTEAYNSEGTWYQKYFFHG